MDVMMRFVKPWRGYQVGDLLRPESPTQLQGLVVAGVVEPTDHETVERGHRPLPM